MASAPAQHSALVLAHSRPGYDPLPHAETEAGAVAGILGTRALVRTDATESAFRQHAPLAPVVHVAAHALLNEAQPSFSRLLLGADAAHDGNVNLYELLQLRLDRTALIVLSACQTQLGPVSAGDEVDALHRALLRSGVRAVLASLWNVDDEVAGMLLKAFHGQLALGASAATALRIAQDTVRRRYPHPYFWAPFVLSGEQSATTLAAPRRAAAD